MHKLEFLSTGEVGGIIILKAAGSSQISRRAGLAKFQAVRLPPTTIGWEADKDLPQAYHFRP